jgi:hypothetical protein
MRRDTPLLMVTITPLIRITIPRSIIIPDIVRMDIEGWTRRGPAREG